MPVFKAIHTADFHLGIKSMGYLRRDRSQDFLNNMNRIASIAKSEEVDLVIIAGDVFHSPRPPNWALYEFARFVKGLVDEGIHVVVVRGNHDGAPIKARRGILDALAEVAGGRFHYFPSIGAEVIRGRSGRSVRIIAIPYVKPIIGSGDYSEALERTRKAVLEKVKSEVEKINEDYGIIVGHLTMAKASPSSERLFTSKFFELPFRSGDLSFSEVSYIALGHIHRWQVVEPRPPIVYSGSIERIDFSERRDEKKYVYIREERGGLKYEAFSLPARRMVEKRVEVGERGPIYLLSVIRGLGDIRGALLKLIVRVGQQARSGFNASEVIRALESAGVFDVFIEVEAGEHGWMARRVDRVYRDVVEAFEEYVSTQRLNGEFMRRVLDRGREILAKVFHGDGQ